LVLRNNQLQSELAQLASRARAGDEEAKRRLLQLESTFRESTDQWATEKRTLEERVSLLQEETMDLRASSIASERAYNELQRSCLFESVHASDQVLLRKTAVRSSSNRASMRLPLPAARCHE
jgi:hypothetical protein